MLERRKEEEEKKEGRGKTLILRKSFKLLLASKKNVLVIKEKRIYRY